MDLNPRICLWQYLWCIASMAMNSSLTNPDMALSGLTTQTGIYAQNCHDAACQQITNVLVYPGIYPRLSKEAVDF